MEHKKLDIRKTQIVYDETLFIFLDHLRAKYKLGKGQDCSYTERFFKQLWDETESYTQDNYRETSNQADKFSLIVALLSPYRSFDRWEDVINDDWSAAHYNNPHSQHCCCKHLIHNAYKMTNKKTGMSVIVGSSCVTSRMITNKSLQLNIEALVAQTRKKKKTEKKIRDEHDRQDIITKTSLDRAQSYPHSKVNWGRWRGVRV
tara:strand:+ start:2894 stop:3502 length:609 start_codon:yes stop_codon:yes gene_type:complete